PVANATRLPSNVPNDVDILERVLVSSSAGGVALAAGDLFQSNRDELFAVAMDGSDNDARRMHFPLSGDPRFGGSFWLSPSGTHVLFHLVDSDERAAAYGTPVLGDENATFLLHPPLSAGQSAGTLWFAAGFQRLVIVVHDDAQGQRLYAKGL